VLLSARVEARQAEMALNDDELSFSLSLTRGLYPRKKAGGDNSEICGSPM